MGIFSWIIVGLFSGSIAKAIMPGSKDEPTGWIATIGLGIVGAIIGGFIGDLLLDGRRANGINLGSIAISVVGACIFIAIVRLIKK